METSESLVVRRARPSDAPKLVAILCDTFESTWRPQVSQSDALAFREEDRPAAYVDLRGQKFWVAEKAGEVVGFVDRDGDFVNALHVRAGHARLGAGSCLMDKAEAAIAASGFETARLETHSFNGVSRAFYRKRGYKEVEQYPDKEWSSGLTTILLVKRLV
ncbi:MAG: GNAT family N-acetyltransferase [Alphaproteobacteria bacterium]|nr:GNAT family N-acetyltransferase [Alphaproteobacteria bacterium]